MGIENSAKIHALQRGAEPGAIILPPDAPASPTRIRLFVYDERSVQEVEVEDATKLDEVDAIRAFGERRDLGRAGEPRPMLWADVEGVRQVEALEAIGRVFGLHPLVLEDVANTEQRAKLEDYEGYLYIVARMLVNRVDPKNPARPWSESLRDLQRSCVASEQVSLIVGPGFVVSVQEADEPSDPEGELEREHGDVFEGVRRRLHQGNGHLHRLGADYLAYSLLDAIVDNYFVIVERLGERVEIVEDEVLQRRAPNVLREVHVLRRDMLDVRRAVWPLREVLGALSRGDEEFISETTRIYLRDVVDHSVEVIDTVETLRDIVTGLLETYLSSVSNRLNEVMKVLTIISTIFMPLSFIVGVYGMNFERLYPGTDDPAGFWTVMGVSLAIVVGMLIMFKRREWI